MGSIKSTAKMLPLIIVITILGGCQSTTTYDDLTRMTFERSHDSIWGIQFYIDMTETEIIEARFFHPGETEQTEILNAPISAETWREIEQAVISLEPNLKEEKKGLFQGNTKKLDGTEKRVLTIAWKTEDGEKTINYSYPATDEAIALEEYLETLVQEM